MQRTDDWYNARRGCVTASMFKDVMAGGETGMSYFYSLLAERLSGISERNYTSTAMQWGNDQEENAKWALMERLDKSIDSCGFITMPGHPMIGASPDGIIDGSMGVEIKCPYTLKEHARTLTNGVPGQHLAQIQGGMMVTGYDQWVFASYHPLYPDNLALSVHIVDRDDGYIAKLKIKVVKFDKDLSELVDQINSNRL